MRAELKFQNHIIDSYKLAGGTAKKWASEWQAGPPDLVCALRGYGVHLMEVKHLPTFTRENKNPMTELQQKVAREYLAAGGMVVLGVVRGKKAINSELGLFNPIAKTIHPQDTVWSPYVPGKKFPIRQALEEYVRLPGRL